MSTRAIPSPQGKRRFPQTSTTGGGLTIVADYAEDIFAPTMGQTVFVLGATPVAGTVTFKVSGQDYSQLGSYFTLVGATVTWLDVPFSLTPNDEILVAYFTP